MTDARIIVALPPSTDLELVAEALTAAGDQRLRAARAASAELAAEVDAGTVRDERTGAVAIHRTLVTAGVLESAAEAIRSGVVDAALAEGDADELTTRIGDLELELGNLGAQLETATEELGAARQRIGDLEAELGPEGGDLAADAVVTAKRIEVLEAALNDAETHRAAAMVRIAELEAAVHAEAELIDELAGRDGTPPGPGGGPRVDHPTPEQLSDRQLSRLPLAELKDHLDRHPEDLDRATALEAAAAKPRKKVTEELAARLELRDAGITVTPGGQTELIVDAGPDVARIVGEATVAQLEQLVGGASTPEALRTAAEEELTLRQPPTPETPPTSAELVKLATTAELEAIAAGDTGTVAGRDDSPIAGTGGPSAELRLAAAVELAARNRIVPVDGIGPDLKALDSDALRQLADAAGPSAPITTAIVAELEARDAATSAGVALDPTEDLEPGELIALEVDDAGVARPVDLPDDEDPDDLTTATDEELTDLLGSANETVRAEAIAELERRATPGPDVDDTPDELAAADAIAEADPAFVAELEEAIAADGADGADDGDPWENYDDQGFPK